VSTAFVSRDAPIAAPGVGATLLERLESLLERCGEQVAVRTLDRATEWTWRGLDELARRAAGGLRAAGVRAGDTVGLLLANRPEFFVLDLATVMLGAVPVSVYATASAEQIAYVAGDAGFRLLFCDAALRAGAARVPCPVHVVEEEFGALTACAPLEHVHRPGPEELLTIIYTSGTTGPPKGVELRHAELMWSMSAIAARHRLQPGEQVICWLPMAHIAERLASYYGAVTLGSTVTTCLDAREIGAALRAVRPTWFFAVPRVWEKLKAGIESSVAAWPADDRASASAVIDRAAQDVWRRQREEPGASGAEGAALFARLRAAVGLDRISTASVGAAPVAGEVIAFFHAIGIPLAEIYGQSEGCAVATCNPPDRIRIGTVGPPQTGVELRLADDGEILVRGPNLMRGYRHAPEATAEAIDPAGWLHTGDVGRLGEDGYLTIVDRKKELIINAAGKNMSPANIEAAIKTHSPLIGQVVAIGDRRPYNVALVALDPDALAGRAPDDPEVVAEVEAAVRAGNERLARVEQVKRHRIIGEPWAPGGEELTPTMKLKRRPIAEKYADVIEELYAD
jgi:long-subunit acyl-CoA synthetase (AMP-forming)